MTRAQQSLQTDATQAHHLVQDCLQVVLDQPQTMARLDCCMLGASDKRPAHVQGHRQVVLIGYSLGAALSIRLAAEHPEHIQGVILLGVGYSRRWAMQDR